VVGHGYPEGIDGAVLAATDEAGYRAAVAAFFAGRRDVTLPEHGWPWPWADSCTTDFAYAFDGNVWACCFGHGWYNPSIERSDEEKEGYYDRPKLETFPDMKARAAVAALGSDQSGIMVFRAVPTA
jgi:hypothetical protein